MHANLSVGLYVIIDTADVYDSDCSHITSVLREEVNMWVGVRQARLSLYTHMHCNNSLNSSD